MQQNDLRILICDDSIMVRKKMDMFLKGNGFTNIFEAGDGQEAIDTYKKINPHVVFMDIVMPIKTGVEALSEIIEFDPAAKVIIVSSIGTQSNLKEAIEKGASDFIQKPIDDAQVLKLLANVMKQLQKD